MVRQTQDLIDINSITSLNDVMNTLERLNDQLNDLQLAQYLLFNKAYLVVTRNMQQAIYDKRFNNPAFIKKFITRFAARYFKAINSSAGKDTGLPLPWQKLTDYAALSSAPVFISLMLGANAHINYDLPQVLDKLMPEDKPDNLLGDLSQMDKLLMESGKEIIGLFEEKNALLDFLKRRFQFMYYRPAMYTILYWRIRAWRGYKALGKDPAAMARITERSVKTANRLLAIGRILG